MADVVIFDEVTNRVLQYLRSVHTPDYITRTDAVVNPDLLLLDGLVPLRYWKHDTGVIVEMSVAEKAQVDTDEQTARTNTNRAGAVNLTSAIDPDGVATREMIELHNKRINYVINRVIQIQEDLQAIKATTGPADNIRAAIRPSYLATNTRTKAEAVQDYTDDINAGNQDI